MRFPFSRLLLATEHTEFDSGSERVAFDLARRAGMPLHGVLPMVSNVEYESIAPEAVLREEERAFAHVGQLRGEAQALGIELDIRVRRGEELYREIVAEARDREADLVVVRRRGRRSILANLLVGEMVGKVVAHVSCSVLLVPRAGRVWTRRVLAGVDGSVATTRVAETAARVATDAGIPLEVVSVAAYKTADGRAQAAAAVAEAVTVARACGALVDGRAVVGQAAETIAELSVTSGADLIVVGRGSPGHRFRPGGNAHRIIGLAACPVLVVKT